jgi:hypothetical protein
VTCRLCAARYAIAIALSAEPVASVNRKGSFSLCADRFEHCSCRVTGIRRRMPYLLVPRALVLLLSQLPWLKLPYGEQKPRFSCTASFICLVRKTRDSFASTWPPLCSRYYLISQRSIYYIDYVATNEIGSGSKLRRSLQK